jgi:hypothetical protein
MNPNTGENPHGFEVPGKAPEGETLPNDALEKGTVKSPENQPQSKTVQSDSQAAASIAVPSQVTAQTFSDDDVGVDDQSVSRGASDTDRIEKQWVEKAKTILAKTKDDPFEQKSQMSKVKADYIKNRFNKTIKTDDAVAK